MNKKLVTARWLIAISLLMSFTGCSSLSNAQAEADVYSVIARAHHDYVEHDVTMASDAKQRRFELLEAWRKRIVANGGVPK